MNIDNITLESQPQNETNEETTFDQALQSSPPLFPVGFEELYQKFQQLNRKVLEIVTQDTTQDNVCSGITTEDVNTIQRIAEEIIVEITSIFNDNITQQRGESLYNYTHIVRDMLDMLLESGCVPTEEARTQLEGVRDEYNEMLEFTLGSYATQQADIISAANAAVANGSYGQAFLSQTDLAGTGYTIAPETRTFSIEQTIENYGTGTIFITPVQNAAGEQEWLVHVRLPAPFFSYVQVGGFFTATSETIDGPELINILQQFDTTESGQAMQGRLSSQIQDFQQRLDVTDELLLGGGIGLGLLGGWILGPYIIPAAAPALPMLNQAYGF